MLDKLRAKAGSERISARLGDFGRDDLGSGFALIFVAFNTLFSLPDQQSQVACFEHVGRALRPGGRFVVEAFVPDLGRFDRGQRTAAVFAGTDLVKLEATTHDPATQSVQSVHLLIREGRVETYPVRLRYAFPSELDLMARIAGLALEARWGSWTAEPFTAASEAHISV
jgi:SAM-dependent methyltransferase